MKFNAELHTVEYLLNHEDVLLKLCFQGDDFGKTDVAGDHRLLTQKIDTEDAAECGFEFENGVEWTSVAHILAREQKSWIDNPASEDVSILSLRDDFGNTVAHELAEHQSLWHKKSAAKNIEVLAWFDDIHDASVAFILAENNPSWRQKLTPKDLSILAMPIDPKNQDAKGSTIAGHLAAKYPKDIHSSLLFNLEYLSIEDTHYHGISKRSGNNHSTLIAHILAHTFEPFYASDFVKNAVILSLKDASNVSVAHAISTIPNHRWDNGNYPLTYEILKLADNNNCTVAHHLVRHRSLADDVARMLWKDEFLLMPEHTENCRNRTIAHLLAENYPDWVMNSNEAYLKEFIFLSYELNEDKKNKVMVSVVECMSYLSLSQKVDRALRAGGALLISGPQSTIIKNCSPLQLETQIDEAYRLGMEYIDDQYNPELKMLGLLSLYSTFEQLKNNVFERMPSNRIKSNSDYHDAYRACKSGFSRIENDLLEMLTVNYKVCEIAINQPEATNQRTKEFVTRSMANLYLNQSAFNDKAQTENLDVGISPLY